MKNDKPIDNFFQAYKYVFYWLYTWQKKMWSNRVDIPQIITSVGLTCCFYATLGSFVLLFNIISGFIIQPYHLPKIITLTIYLVVLFFHYFTFVHNDRLNNLIEEFSSETEEEFRKKGKFVLLYIFGSYALLIFLAFVNIWLKSSFF